ncbi:hypothetical protein AB0I87_12510 [Streptomyces sp. NPDC049952]|uniref:Uncharacterized protein n=1 Tax=Streptomyces pratensis (strain ATCC 33331 / IAF-45CD) TaxID=591167 RepID=A0A8D3WLM4_STRFA|nr:MULTISPECIES: hypothetical protein [Streptomyces]MYT53254.1 hypothetical protein [Streptomyces sp. SID7815]WKV80320.1 hypothetical protein HBB06_20370 [Streptomyces sp. SNU607]WSI19822.1 hypothetical protein OG336_23615 [[Kitasatospora] papulosa]
MTDPYQPQPSPFITTPLPAARPRMFNSTVAKAIWILVPILTISIGAAVPFVVAAVKGVVKPWLAIVYVAAEVLILGISTAANGDSPFIGMLMIFLIVTSATHTSLLDNDRVNIGK